MTTIDERTARTSRRTTPKPPPKSLPAQIAERLGLEPPDEQTRERAAKVDMVRTTVKVSVDLDMRVRHEAARRGMTLSEWTREALEAHLPGGAERPVYRHLFAAGAGDSGRSDISERMEEILYGAMMDDDDHR